MVMVSYILLRQLFCAMRTPYCVKADIIYLGEEKSLGAINHHCKCFTTSDAGIIKHGIIKYYHIGIVVLSTSSNYMLLVSSLASADTTSIDTKQPNANSRIVPSPEGGATSFSCCEMLAWLTHSVPIAL